MPRSRPRYSASAGTAALLLIAGCGHVVYPAWLALAAGRRPDPPAPEPGEGSWPAVTVVVPAYREREVIADKVADLRGNGYPGELRVLVVADDDATAEAAAQTDAELLTPAERLGKASALNVGIGHASTPVVVFTDANAAFAPGALAALVRWFADPGVGAVAGEKRVAGEGESAYWRFEAQLKRWETRLGTTIGLVGEIGAIRRTAFRPLPPGVAVDDLWMALDVLAGGGRIVYEPAAVAFEAESATWAELWERRTRVVAGAMDVLWRRRALLAPRHGVVAAQLWGHRLIRQSAGPVAHGLLLARALRAAPGSPVAGVVVLVHAAAGAALVRARRGAQLSRPESLLAHAALLQLVALGGLWRYLRGDRPALWPKPERTIGLDGSGG